MHIILHKPSPFRIRHAHHHHHDVEQGTTPAIDDGLDPPENGELGPDDEEGLGDDGDADRAVDIDGDGDGEGEGEGEDEDGGDRVLPRPRRGVPFQSYPTFSTFPTIELQSTFYTTHTTRDWWTRLKGLIRPPPSASREFIPNYRWLPIVSGIVVPFAILLEIPGLTMRWYVRTEGFNIVETQPNPPLLSAGVALSFVSGVLANFALISRFFEYRVKLMTILAILFLTTHDILNIIIVTTFGVIHRVNDGFTYGQPFWITICSTVTSLFANITLIVDLIRTPDFSKSGSGLTRKQRSLVIVIMILLVWIALGALVYSLLIGLTFIDGLYFTVVSIETIGFGDITPNNTSSRVFAIFYNATGILNVALAVSTMRETVIESFEVSYRNRMAMLKRWRKAHRAHRANASARKQHTLRSKLGSVGNMGSRSHMQLRGRKGSVSDALAIIPAPDDGSVLAAGPKPESEKAIVLPREGEMEGALERRLPLAAAPSSSASAAEENEKGPRRSASRTRMSSVPDLRSMSYEAVKKTVEDDERKEFFVHLAVAWGLFITFWIAGTLIFMASEKWSFGIAMYFCFMAFSTIGYGDYSPKSQAGRSIFVVWALLGVATMTILISVLSEAYSSRYKSVLHNSTFRSAIDNYRKTQSNRPASPLQAPTRRPNPVPRANGTADADDQDPEYDEEREASPDRDTTEALHSRAQDHLEALPREVLLSARNFHQHVQYFASGSSRLGRAPFQLTRLLDDIVEAEQLDARLRDEVLQDDDAMKALLIMSCELALRKMVNHAQLTLSLLRERDLMKERDNDNDDDDRSTNDSLVPTHQARTRSSAWDDTVPLPRDILRRSRSVPDVASSFFDLRAYGQGAGLGDTATDTTGSGLVSRARSRAEYLRELEGSDRATTATSEGAQKIIILPPAGSH